MGDESGPKFAYSIGIETTSHQPDLLVTGLDLDLAHWIINEYNRRLRSGETFVRNRPYDGFIEGFPVLFSPMRKEHYRDYLGWGLWFYRGDDFRLFQLIYPDTSGRWLWDQGISENYRWSLPLLAEAPIPLRRGG